MNCPKCAAQMVSTAVSANTAEKNSAKVTVEVCLGCKGVWLDDGELNAFARPGKMLSDFSAKGLLFARDSLLSCPKCESKSMQLGQIPEFEYKVDACATCHGLFFEEHEFLKINGTAATRIATVSEAKKTIYKAVQRGYANQNKFIAVLIALVAALWGAYFLSR